MLCRDKDEAQGPVTDYARNSREAKIAVKPACASFVSLAFVIVRCPANERAYRHNEHGNFNSPRKVVRRNATMLRSLLRCYPMLFTPRNQE